MRQKTPVYEFFKKSGIVIPIDHELGAAPDLLNEPLLKEERRRNKEFANDFWSREKD